MSDIQHLDLTQALFNACITNDIKSMQLLIESKADPTSTYNIYSHYIPLEQLYTSTTTIEIENTLLHAAIISRSTTMIDYVINDLNINDIECYDDYQFTPLIIAIRCGDINMIQHLIHTYHADYTLTGIFNDTILIHILQTPQLYDIYVYLTSLTTSFTIDDIRSILPQLLQWGELTTIQYLITKYPTLIDDTMDDLYQGLNPLHYAAQSNNIELIDFIINTYQFNIESLSITNMTPILYAISSPRSNLHLIQHLIDKYHAHLHNNQWLPNTSILHLYIISKQERCTIELIQYFISNGLHFENEIGEKTIPLLIEYNYPVDIIQYVLHNGAAIYYCLWTDIFFKQLAHNQYNDVFYYCSDLNLRSTQKPLTRPQLEKLLLHCVSNANFTIAKIIIDEYYIKDEISFPTNLLSHILSTSLPNNELLQYTLQYNLYEYTIQLYSYRFNPFNDILFQAIQSHWITIDDIQCLIKHGANIDIIGTSFPYDGQNIYHCMFNHSYQFKPINQHKKIIPSLTIISLIQDLLQINPKFDLYDREHLTPFAYMCKMMNFNHPNSILLFWSILRLPTTININTYDHYHYTPLHTAIQSNQFNLVKLLIQANVNVEVRTKQRFTPFLIAFDIQSKEQIYLRIKIVKYLLQHNVNAFAQNQYQHTFLHILILRDKEIGSIDDEIIDGISDFMETIINDIFVLK